jgi:hypothetical protein
MIAKCKKQRQSEKYTKAKSDLKIEKEYNEKLIVEIQYYAKEVASCGGDDLLRAAYELQWDRYQGRLNRSNKRLEMYQARFDETQLAEEFGLNIWELYR